MKGSKLYECKDCCGKLSLLCHNTKNRSLEIKSLDIEISNGKFNT